MSDPHDLIEIAATGATFRLFNEVTFADPPARIPLLPKSGTYQHPVYGSIAITPDRNKNFAANINNAIFQKYIPINAEHSKGDVSGALGWFSSAVLNSDGSVDAEVEWSDRGKSMIASNAFKYVSPEWHDRWTDPANQVEHQDVVVGLALTTRPFFKDSSLRPLVASDGEFIVPPTEEGTEQGMTQATDESSKSKGQAMAENEKTFTEQQYNDLKGQVETLTKQFTDADGARKTAEESAKTFADRVAALETAAQDRELRDLVKTFSMPADEAHHLDILKALPVDKHEAYVAKEKAQTDITKSVLFNERGSDAFNPTSGSAEAALDAKAKTLMASESGLTYAEAYVKAFQDPDLRHKLAVERMGGN